jgi:arabinose-5-phosphate isomerase
MPLPIDESVSHRATRAALRTFELERNGILALEQAFAQGGELSQAFEATVRLICSVSGRVIVTGMGKSGHIARKLAATLASTGTPSYFVHPGEASHGDLGMIRRDDVVIALSWSGETAELADILTYCRRFRIALVAMTANRESALWREAELRLCLPVVEEACPNGLAPTTSTTMQLALGDALAVALLEARGFTAGDFQLFHPGGKLGARLTYLRDVMHRGERMPIVASTAFMSEALVEMSAKGFGFVAVVSADSTLIGIITDGDLRRHMRSDLPTAAVVEVMTKNPVAIHEDCLAAEALEIMNSRKINALVVVDGVNSPVGVVHLHDLVRLGVV